MKKCLSLLLCLVLLCSVLPVSTLAYGGSGARNEKLDAAFESGSLKLAETALPICQPSADDLELSEGLLAYLKARTGSEDPAAELTADYSPERLQLLSLSPSGGSALFIYAGWGLSLYGGKYHLLYPAYEKGVEDAYGNLQTYAERYATRMFTDLIGSEGVVYSPDGRYAAVYNVKRTVYNGHFDLDPVLIDLSTGEMILTATYPNKMKEENAGAVTTACFSADSRTFYYMVYGRFGENRMRLCRYDLAAGTTETLLETELQAWRPHLSMTAGGDFLVVVDDPKESALGIAENREGSWIMDRKAPAAGMKLFRLTDLRYSANSGYAVLAGGMGSGFSSAFQVLEPDGDLSGFNQYLSLEKATDRIVAMTAEEYENAIREDMERMAGQGNQQYAPGPDYPYRTILNVILSPDGHYALLNTSGTSREGHSRDLFLVRLDDLAVRKVGGLDAGKILVGPLAGPYQINIEWNTEDLIIGTDDGIRTYRFEY